MRFSNNCGLQTLRKFYPDVINQSGFYFKYFYLYYFNMLELIKCPILTKKTTRILEQYGQYVFDVCPKLTKFQIRFLIETMFSVQVISVNTHIRYRAKSGRFKVFPATYKRAIVKVRSDEKIILFPNSLSSTLLGSIENIYDF